MMVFVGVENFLPLRYDTIRFLETLQIPNGEILIYQNPIM